MLCLGQNGKPSGEERAIKACDGTYVYYNTHIQNWLDAMDDDDGWLVSDSPFQLKVSRFTFRGGFLCLKLEQRDSRHLYRAQNYLLFGATHARRKKKEKKRERFN